MKPFFTMASRLVKGNDVSSPQLLLAEILHAEALLASFNCSRLIDSLSGKVWPWAGLGCLGHEASLRHGSIFGSELPEELITCD